MGIVYTKQPISIADQISKLKSQGLIIVDPNKAEKILGEVRKEGVFGMEDLFGIVK